MAGAWTMPDTRPHLSGTIAVAFSSYKPRFTTTEAGSSASSSLVHYSSFAIPPTSSNLNPHFRNFLPQGAFPFSPTLIPNRARSEPPADTSIDTDIEMEPPVPIKRSQSHWNFSTPADLPTAIVCPALLEVSEPESQSQSQNESQPRAASPAPTEIDDPEPDYLANNLQSMGIRIRDFAYEHNSTLSPVKELFDQNDAMAEYEFRLSQNPRYYPIPGKTLRRLLDLGWINIDEVMQRCHQMDLEELKKVDSRPAWPYALRFSSAKAVSAPSAEERRLMRDARRTQFMRLDRFRRMAEAAIARQEKDAQEADVAVNMMRERQKANALQKRPLRFDDGDGVEDDGESSGDQKRRKMSEEVESQPWSQAWSQPSAQKPDKQYPAPLSSYDPELYPEAASFIESQSQSQPRTVIPPRIDTPPLEEEDLAPNALRRPNKGLKRTLSRTQTFTQL